MLAIRSQQVRTFEDASWQSFELELEAHLRSFAPALCNAAGDEGVRAAVQRGGRRARDHGFKTRGAIALYVELMSVLGSGFDTDPQLPWARDTLRDPALRHEAERSGWLYDRATVYLDEVAGDANRHAIAALRRLLGSDLLDKRSTRAPDEDAVIAAMHAIYPQKAAFVGDPVLRAIHQRSAEEAAERGLPVERGAAALAALEFALGHAILSDPLYPWVAGALSEPAATDGDARLTRLLGRIRAYATRTLEELDAEGEA